MADAIFEDPRLAGVYDPLDPDRSPGGRSWCRASGWWSPGEEVTDVSGQLVTFRSMTAFRHDDLVVESVSTLRFRGRAELETSLVDVGFEVAEVRDAPDRPGREFVFLACARQGVHPDEGDAVVQLQPRLEYNCTLKGSDTTGGSMPEEFEGDLAGAVFWGADLSGARFRDVNLTDVKISHAWLVNVEIDALVDTVVINGVDVTAYVNERDPWYPLRAMLRPSDPEGMRAAWAALEGEWAKTVTRALALPEDRLHESVNNEWSFVQTLRHLVFAMDKWFTAPILGGSFHPFGLPNSGSVDFPWPDVDYDLTPSVSETLAVRAERATRFRDYLATVAPTDFTRPIDVLENGPNPLQECIYTVFEEEFWHNRYAQRDLAQLEAAN